MKEPINNQTNQVIHRQKLANQLTWNGELWRDVTKISSVNNELNITKITWMLVELWSFDKARNVIFEKKAVGSIEET